MKRIIKVLIIVGLLLFTGCSSTKLVYQVNGTTVIGVWEK